MSLSDALETVNKYGSSSLTFSGLNGGDPGDVSFSGTMEGQDFSQLSKAVNEDGSVTYYNSAKETETPPVVEPPVVEPPVVDDPVVEPDPEEPGALAGAGYKTLAGEVGKNANLADYSGIEYEQSIKRDANGEPIRDANGNTISTQPGIESGENFINDKSTVAGQLESILSKGSPLQALAQSRAREQASALGMMSSSAGIGASQRALYDSAMPIAKQDAEQAHQLQQTEQKYKNDQDIINTEAIVAGDMLVHNRKIQDKAIQTEKKWQLLTKSEDTNVAAAAKIAETKVARENAILNHEMTLELNQVPLDAAASADFTAVVAEATHDISTQISGALGDSTFVDNHVIYKPWGGEVDADGEKIMEVDKTASDAAWDRSMNTFIDVTKAGLILDLKAKGTYTPERAADINAWASNVYRERGVQR